MAIDLLKYMIWKNGTGGGGASYEKTVGPAPIISISDAKAKPAKSLIVGMEPIQDLHGYDSPWPAGSGANLLDLDKASYNTLAYGLTVARDGDGVRITGTATSSGNLSFNLIINYADDSLSGKGYVLQVFDVTTGYTVGAVWGFRTESERAFAISLNRITEGQVVNCFMRLSVASTSQTAWSPYSNICPIYGWKTVNVWNDPKYGGNIEWNQLLPETGTENTGRGVTCTPNGDGSWTLTGNGTGTYRHEILPFSGVNVNDVIIFTSGCDTKGSGSTFYVSLRYSSGSSVNGSTQIKMVKADQPFDIYSVHTFSGFVAPEGGLIIKPQVFNLTQMFGATVADSVWAMEQAEAGSGIAWFQNLFPNAYYPYNAGTPNMTVSEVNGDPYWKVLVVFPDSVGTVYGGTVDVVSGVLTVDRVKETKLWSQGSASGTATDIQMKAFYPSETADVSDKTKFKCNLAPVVSSYGVIGFLPQGGTQFYVTLPTETDGSTQIEMVYVLDTPITYQLTPQQIQLLKGANVLWSDGDALTLTYIGTQPANLLGGMLGNPQEPVSEEPEAEPVSEEPEE